jgi:hypothetical protein
MLRRLALIPMAGAMLLVAAWALGCVLNDRWSWSQWLWWIPAPVALASTLVWLACAVAQTRGTLRRASVVGAVGSIVVTGASVASSFSPVSRAHGAASLHLLCWNARWPGEQAAACARALKPWSDRVVVISNPGRLAEHASVWMHPGDSLAEAGTFLITGPVRVLEARPVVQGDDGFATLFRFVAEGVGETSILAVDLPSNPFRPRFAALARFGALVSASVDLRTIDLVVGDFNCTRGSASVHAAFPGFTDAWTQAGQGWGASWPREQPILHIDLALVSGRMRTERAELHDPGIGHHRFQALSVARPAR